MEEAGGSGGLATGGAGGAGGSEPEAGGGAAGTPGVGEPGEGSISLNPELLQACSGADPVRCELPVDDGNHTVTVRVGPGTTRIQSELYRISALPAGGMEQEFTFSVNVRPEQHDGYSAPGGVLDLLIEGSPAELIGLGTEPAPDIPTIFVAGDSTVCDWDPALPGIVSEDQRGWAQGLTQYLTSQVAVANFADSGETAAGFYGKFFGPARDAMREGDYLFIQFGHNDQKNSSTVNGYQDNLMRYVNDARDRGATPVLFTPAGRKGASLGNTGFAGLDEQARELAANEGIALIDLTVLSIEYYATVANKDDLFVDGTHFSEVGASGLAGVVAQAIAESELPLAEFVR